MSDFKVNQPETEADRGRFSELLAETRDDAENFIKTAEDQLKSLNEMKWRLRYTTPILAAAILLNLWLMLEFRGEFYIY